MAKPKGYVDREFRRFYAISAAAALLLPRCLCCRRRAGTLPLAARAVALLCSDQRAADDTANDKQDQYVWQHKNGCAASPQPDPALQ